MKKENKNDAKLRFNIIDFLIIIIVVGCIAGTVIRYNIIDRIVLDTKRDEVTISFLVPGISPQIAEAINEGEEYYVAGSNYSMGKIGEPRIAPAQIIDDNEEGKPVVSDDSTLRDVRGSFVSYGVLNDDGFFLSGTMFLAPGNSITVESKSATFSLIITEISHD